MQPITRYTILIAQGRSDTIAPKTELSSSEYTIVFAIMCVPMLFFAHILGRKAYRKHRAKVLKQQVTKLERSWNATYKEKQDH